MTSARFAAALALLLCACAAPAPRAPQAGSTPRAASPPAPDGLGAARAPRLGRHATPAEVARLDIDVAPDGAGLPPGGGDAREGAPIYAARCAHCHGVNGEEGPANRLVGGIGSLVGSEPILTVGSFWPFATTLFDYLRRAMPYDAPGSLSADEVYALTAFLLVRNGVVEPGARLDARSLPAVRMPNRDGFVRAGTFADPPTPLSSSRPLPGRSGD